MLGNDQVSEETEILSRTVRLAACLGDWQAGVEAFHRRELVRAGLHDVRDLVQDAGTLAREHGWPWTVFESVLRGGNRSIDVCDLAGGSLDVGLVGDWVEDVEGVAVDRVNPLAADVVADLIWNCLLYTSDAADE